jgi:hypothetical protein
MDDELLLAIERGVLSWPGGRKQAHTGARVTFEFHRQQFARLVREGCRRRSQSGRFANDDVGKQELLPYTEKA